MKKIKKFFLCLSRLRNRRDVPAVHTAHPQYLHISQAPFPKRAQGGRTAAECFFLFYVFSSFRVLVFLYSNGYLVIGIDTNRYPSNIQFVRS